MRVRIWAVVRKELRDFRRNKLVVGTMVFLPIVLILIPIANVIGVKASMPFAAVKNIVGGATLTFFLVPLILPTVIAGYSVVGEREQGTLEPVLTTPVTREELLIGKALSAVLPSVAIAYLLFAIFVIAVRAYAVPTVVHLVWQPYQFVAAILFAPLLSAFSIWVGLAISARSSDVRVAQQLSAMSMLPMIGVITLFTFRVISPSVTVAVIGAIALLALDLAAWRVVSAMFDRERLLTRYGPAIR